MLTDHAANSKKLQDYFLTYGLWLGTALMAVYEIALVRNIVLTIYAWIMTGKNGTPQLRTSFEGAAISQGATILMAIFAIAVIMGGFEFHHKRIGDPKSLRLLVWTIGIQVFILLAGLLILNI